MKKKVYCHIGKQCKPVTFISEEGTSDEKQIRHKLQEICARDVNLNSMIQNQTIVLQIKDSDKDVWCDIEEDDEVPDKVDINVIFTSSASELILPLSSIDNLLSVQPSTSRQDETMPAGINVIYTEPVNKANNDEEMELVIDIDKENQTQIDADNESSDVDDDVPKSEPATPALSKIPSTSTSTRGPGVFTSLPPLTYDLEKKLEKKSVVEVQNDLIYHWGSYLWNSTNGAPSKQQYQDFATSIVRNYPLLASADGDSVIVRRSLSAWVRNHRFSLKQKLIKSDAKEKKASSQSSATLVTKQESYSESDVNSALKELEKKNNEGNTAHVRRLLKITSKVRRAWIENHPKSICEIVNKYPQLKNDELVIFEFLNFKDLDLKDIHKNVTSMFQKLAKFFNIDINTEKSKVSAIQKLYDELKKRSQKHVSLFTVKEERSPPDDLNTNKNESPRCVIYTAQEEIAAAYIVADQEIKMNIENPSTEKILICLLAVYYVWHIQYPKLFLNVMEYFDHELIGTPVNKKNQVLLKFLRKRDVQGCLDIVPSKKLKTSKDIKKEK